MTKKNQLNPADVELIRKAREAKMLASQNGVQIEDAMVHSEPSMAYDTFIPVDGLPSGGNFYTNRIAAQPLKVEDLLLIQTINDRNYQRVFNEIFARRIRGIEPGEILVGDEIYLAIWLRANSYPGHGFPHDGFVCENVECGTEVPSGSTEFGFGDMDFTVPNLKEIMDVYGRTGNVAVTLKSGIKVFIAIKRRKHVNRVELVLHRDYYAFGRTPTPEMTQLLTIASVVSFDGMSADILETVERIKQLSPVDFVDLLKYMKKYSISGEPKISLECPVCKEATRFTGYVFRSDFYIPVDE